MVSETFVLKLAQAKARIWPRLAYWCRIRSTADLSNLTITCQEKITLSNRSACSSTGYTTFLLQTMYVSGTNQATFLVQTMNKEFQSLPQLT